MKDRPPIWSLAEPWHRKRLEEKLALEEKGRPVTVMEPELHSITADDNDPGGIIADHIRSLDETRSAELPLTVENMVRVRLKLALIIAAGEPDRARQLAAQAGHTLQHWAGTGSKWSSDLLQLLIEGAVVRAELGTPIDDGREDPFLFVERHCLAYGGVNFDFVISRAARALELRGEAQRARALLDRLAATGREEPAVPRLERLIVSSLPLVELEAAVAVGFQQVQQLPVPESLISRLQLEWAARLEGLGQTDQAAAVRAEVEQTQVARQAAEGARVNAARNASARARGKRADVIPPPAPTAEPPRKRRSHAAAAVAALLVGALLWFVLR